MKRFIVSFFLLFSCTFALAQSENDEDFKTLNELKKIVPKSKMQQATVQKLIEEEMERLRKSGKLKVNKPR